MGDDPVIAAIEELGERVLDQKRTIYQLTREVRRLRVLELSHQDAVRSRRAVASVLAAVTWAESLEQAQEIASAALRGEFSHDDPPSSDAPNITDTDPESKDDREQ